MAVKIHFFDRRNGERKVVDWAEFAWDGPFYFEEHSGSDDGNRCRWMHGTEDLSYASYLNLIVIEKIESDGQVVYQEEATPLPPRVLAIVVGRHCFDKLSDSEINAKDRRPAAMAKMREARTALAACEDTGEYIALLDAALECAGKIQAYETDDSVQLDVVAEYDKLADLDSEYCALTEEASKPYNRPSGN